MRRSRPRTELEGALAGALSRYIGYTTGAYDLERIVSTLSAFDASSSVYVNEILAAMRSRSASGEGRHPRERRADDGYLTEALHFAEALCIIESVSPKEARVRRYAPTEQGRALRGARASQDEGFFRFFLTRIVLLADADAMFPILEYFFRSYGGNLQGYYQAFHGSLRRKRLSWLLEAVPEPTLQSRILGRIPWIRRHRYQRGPLEPERISNATSRHHATPRRGWLRALGMLDERGECLTSFGRAIRDALVSKGDFFWLGPDHRVQEELGIAVAVQKGGPFEDTFGLGAEPIAPTLEEEDRLLADAADVMRVAYRATKLKHAPQATLRLPIEYIRYRQFSDKRAYLEDRIIARIFATNRGEFVRLSARVGHMGFYKWVPQN